MTEGLQGNDTESGDREMKKIVLIGDSIRLGYDQYVKKAFEGAAQVYYPAENCRFTTYVLRFLGDWKRKMECGDDVDLVHWNAGLWDDLRMEDGMPLISLAQYEENVGRICDAMGKLFPRAKLIFATSTPVREELFLGECKRYNRDTERYNERAAAVVRAKGGEVNDLYALLRDCPTEYYSDMTHFYTEAGSRVITEQVVRVIGESLGLRADGIDMGALFSLEQGTVGF